MEVIYDHWAMTMLFISAWGFWYAVGNASNR